MDPPDRARLTLFLDQQLRETLQTAVTLATPVQTEQLEIAGAVIALLLRRMYRERGEAWLTRVLHHVLQPPD